MQYSDEYLGEQLPEERPPLELVPRDVLGEIERGVEFWKDPALVSRSIQWTYALFSELALGRFKSRGGRWGWWPASPGGSYVDVAIGLYDRDAETPGFGLVANVFGGRGPGFEIVDSLEFPRLGRDFPVAVRSVELELHGPPNPEVATSTCWARCNSTQAWGVVTAGHAVGTGPLGFEIPLDDGTTGIAHRSYFQPIDAAFILAPAPRSAPGLLPIVNFPAAGVPVRVACKDASRWRQVVSACNSLGFYRTRSYPIHFFIDQPCSPGDSGALVQALNGDAAGIYCGGQPSPDTGGQSGRVLNFAQAMFALDTTAYL